MSNPEISPVPAAALGRSLVPTPAVVGHRGASGQRPEHTLDAYRLAIRMGADDIELDVVPTKDGVLVARHDATLFATTDVADHPEFADRRTTRVVDGEEHDDWFVEDFTFEELRTLRARERFRKVRRANTAFHGQLAVPSLDEVLTLVALESRLLQRTIGVLIELKHAAYYAARGLDVVAPLLTTLRDHGVDHDRSRVMVMCFEPTVLRQVAARSSVGIIQLLDRKGRPADLAAAGEKIRYADLLTPAGLSGIREYAQGVGVHKELVLERDTEGRTSGIGAVVDDAHRAWLTVHVWTLRVENRWLPLELRSDERPGHHGDLATEARLLLEAGVDGLITDNPDLVLAARADHLASVRGLPSSPPTPGQRRRLRTAR
ncbi:glycerophosphodiester phosphodiesterase family protein [Nocardioides jiangxiensis]|uniref:glycerophosphodiester phosphodiesterase n=1 Tax=Nocardioides jiangxiensis TaxID=3064524 RepID=A0ABT9B348_9ACTN|nr:glycerophosphodiester phosphodiesterase family protein [Nocardioides sp. WY-20]MDO7867588.1 glycerophosphodiester phosphodiesterase family protein [Nocardioides sp. WY-20]